VSYLYVEQVYIGCVNHFRAYR